MAAEVPKDPTETIKCDINQIPEKTIFDLYKLNLRNFCKEYLTQLTFNNIEFRIFKLKYISTVALIDEYFKSITTDKGQKTNGGNRHFNNFISVIIILCLKLDLYLKYKKVDEPEYEDLGAVKSEIGTHSFDLIMSMFIIYINNDYDDEDKKLRIEEIISHGKKKGLFFKKKCIIYGGSEAPRPSVDKDAEHLYLKYDSISERNRILDDIFFKKKYIMYKKKYLKLKHKITN
jgi:hypothetical protein